MAQTAAGIIKARKTIRDNFGLTEDGRSILHVEAGRLGGLKGAKDGVTKGFAAMSLEKRQEAGRLGGAKSKRGSKKI